MMYPVGTRRTETDASSSEITPSESLPEAHFHEWSVKSTDRSPQEKEADAPFYEALSIEFEIAAIDEMPATPERYQVRTALDETTTAEPNAPSALLSSPISDTTSQHHLLKTIEAEIKRQIANTLFPPNLEESKMVLPKKERRELARHIFDRVPVDSPAAHWPKAIRSIVYEAIAFVFPDASIPCQLLDKFGIQLNDFPPLAQEAFISAVQPTLDKSFQATQPATPLVLLAFSNALTQLAENEWNISHEMLLSTAFPPEISHYLVDYPEESISAAVATRLHCAHDLLSLIIEQHWIPNDQPSKQHLLCIRAAVSLMSISADYSAHLVFIYLKTIYPLIQNPFGAPATPRTYATLVTFCFGQFGRLALDYAYNALSKKQSETLLADVKEKLNLALPSLCRMNPPPSLPNFDLPHEINELLGASSVIKLQNVIEDAKALYYFKRPLVDLKSAIELLDFLQPLYVEFLEVSFDLAHFLPTDEEKIDQLNRVNYALEELKESLFGRLRNEAGMVAGVIHQFNAELIAGAPPDIIDQLAILGGFQNALAAYRQNPSKSTLKDMQECFGKAEKVVESISGAIRTIENESRLGTSARYTPPVILPALEKLFAFANQLLK